MSRPDLLPTEAKVADASSSSALVSSGTRTVTIPRAETAVPGAIARQIQKTELDNHFPSYPEGNTYWEDVTRSTMLVPQTALNKKIIIYVNYHLGILFKAAIPWKPADLDGELVPHSDWKLVQAAMSKLKGTDGSLQLKIRNLLLIKKTQITAAFSHEFLTIAVSYIKYRRKSEDSDGTQFKHHQSFLLSVLFETIFSIQSQSNHPEWQEAAYGAVHRLILELRSDSQITDSTQEEGRLDTTLLRLARSVYREQSTVLAKGRSRALSGHIELIQEYNAALSINLDKALGLIVVDCDSLPSKELPDDITSNECVALIEFCYDEKSKGKKVTDILNPTNLKKALALKTFFENLKEYTYDEKFEFLCHYLLRIPLKRMIKEFNTLAEAVADVPLDRIPDGKQLLKHDTEIKQEIVSNPKMETAHFPVANSKQIQGLKTKSSDIDNYINSLQAPSMLKKRLLKLQDRSNSVIKNIEDNFVLFFKQVCKHQENKLNMESIAEIHTGLGNLIKLINGNQIHLLTEESIMTVRAAHLTLQNSVQSIDVAAEGSYTDSFYAMSKMLAPLAEEISSSIFSRIVPRHGKIKESITIKNQLLDTYKTVTHIKQVHFSLNYRYHKSSQWTLWDEMLARPVLLSLEQAVLEQQQNERTVQERHPGNPMGTNPPRLEPFSDPATPSDRARMSTKRLMPPNADQDDDSQLEGVVVSDALDLAPTLDQLSDLEYQWLQCKVNTTLLTLTGETFSGGSDIKICVSTKDLVQATIISNGADGNPPVLRLHDGRFVALDKRDFYHLRALRASLHMLGASQNATEPEESIVISRQDPDQVYRAGLIVAVEEKADSEASAERRNNGQAAGLNNFFGSSAAASARGSAAPSSSSSSSFLSMFSAAARNNNSQ